MTVWFLFHSSDKAESECVTSFVSDDQQRKQAQGFTHDHKITGWAGPGKLDECSICSIRLKISNTANYHNGRDHTLV